MAGSGPPAAGALLAPFPPIVDTAILGGGISALGCAHRLHELGRTPTLIAPELGGRLRPGPTGAPLGASYLTADYLALRPFVDRAKRGRVHTTGVLVDGQPTTIRDYTLRHLGVMTPLIRHLRTVRRHHRRLRRKIPGVGQLQALREDPFLADLVATPADQWVEAHGLAEQDREVLGPIARSTMFVPTAELDAFTWSICLYPFVVRAWTADSRDTVFRLTQGWEDRIVVGTVTRLHAPDADGLWRIELDGGELRARNVVLATPDGATRAFAPELAGHSRQVEIRTVQLVGTRRAPFDQIPILFLPEPHRLTVLWAQPDGVEVVFDLGGADLGEWFTDVEILADTTWSPGIQLSNGRWRPLNPEPGLYTIGDHNLCGLEDSFLTGVFAAERIAESTS